MYFLRILGMLNMQNLTMAVEKQPQSDHHNITINDRKTKYFLQTIIHRVKM